MQIYLARNGERQGPFSAEQVQQMLSTGQYAMEDQYWTDGMAGWLPLSHFATAYASAGARIPTLEKRVTYAGFWIRFVAAIIDGMIIGAPFQLISMLVMPQFKQGDDPTRFLQQYSGLFVVFWITQIIVDLAYHTVMEGSEKQGTVGKLLLGIKVGDEQGRRISYGRAFGRNMAKYLSMMIFGIGFIMAGIDSRKQALHDKLAGTFCRRTT